MLIHGDCLEKLKELPDNSIDAIVTDPPYGLAFMGKKWDYDVPSVEIWKEALRVLKPGGHLLSFGGTRTYHRMVVNIEDAGFEIRDQLQWIYGSGFPKSLDVSKAMDKAAGAEREVVENRKFGARSAEAVTSGASNGGEQGGYNFKDERSITAPSTELAKQWQGWGTALKPANEPIVLARKPLIGTVAQNVENYGTGALNIDASRIGAETIFQHGPNDSPNVSMSGRNYAEDYGRSWVGRWPANVLFDEEAAALLDEQSGITGSNFRKQKGGTEAFWNNGSKEIGEGGHNDSGGASRFFYCAKASKSERNAGLDGMPERLTPKMDGGQFINPMTGISSKTTMRQNHHPTVKPLKLMQYLVKLITPPNGTVLDPFMGSGTTGVAAISLGFNFIGIEREAEYVEIAKRRIENATP